MNACSNMAPAGFTGHWRDWHRGHGCPLDDGRPRSTAGQDETVPSVLTDAELRTLRASSTSENERNPLVRAIDELIRRRAADKVQVPAFDHSALRAKHFESLLGYCVCVHCVKLPEREELP